MPPLAHLLRLRLRLRRRGAVGTAWRRLTAQVCAPLLAAVFCLLAGGCAQQAGEAVFRLDQQTGAPVVGVGTEQYRMDWRGRLALGSLLKTDQADIAPYSLGKDLSALPPDVAALIKPKLAGEMQLVYVAPGVPAGWRRCVAVTVRESGVPPSPKGKSHSRPHPLWRCRIFDAQTGEPLADINLNAIFNSLYYEEAGPDFRAEVRSAYTGPDGGIGLLLWFAHGGEYFLDGGIWDGATWTPLMCIQPSGAAGQDQVIYVGPGNNSILQTRYSLFFSGSDGRLLNIWILKGSFLRLFRQTLLLGLVKALLLATLGGLAAVGTLGFIWQHAIGFSRRRRQS
jgi:hypothetical protein